MNDTDIGTNPIDRLDFDVRLEKLEDTVKRHDKELLILLGVAFCVAVALTTYPKVNK